MKRLLSILLILVPVLLGADNVTEDRARIVAEKFFQSQPHTRGTEVRLQLVWDGESELRSTHGSISGNRLSSSGLSRSDADGSPSFYLYNNEAGKGYIIIAGDDVAMPVLGYSLETNVTASDIPSNFLSWMDYLKEEISYARSHGVDATPRIRAEWEAYSGKNYFPGKNYGNVVVEHLTASWDQDDPFWNECPKIGNRRTYSGCVITALSIVMKFNRWPDAGTGSTDPYVTANIKHRIDMPARKLGKAYDWDLMPMRYYDSHGNRTYTADQAEQIARLMADLGSALSADYGLSSDGGTGAFTSDIPGVMAKHFKYDKSAACLERDHYSASEWLRMIKAEVDRRPLVYSGVSSDGGHAFVLDGYTDRDYFHVNWGWSGMSDGFFLLTALDPENQGAGGASSGFNSYQDAIFNLVKDEGGVAQDLVALYPINQAGWVYNGIEVSSSNIRKGVPFKLTAGLFVNNGVEDFDGNIYISLAGNDGQPKETLLDIDCTGKNVLAPGMGFGVDDETVSIESDLFSGDRIKAFYKSSRMSSSKPVLGSFTDGLAYEYVIPDTEEDKRKPDELVSFSWNRKENSIVLLLKEKDVAYRLEDSSGRDVSSKCIAGSEEVTIKLSDLPSGRYTLIFTRGKDVKKLAFKI